VKIALLSDTHSFLDPLCVKHCESADEIFHAGDIGDLSVLEQLQKIKPTSAVYGNIDGQIIRSCSPRYALLEREGLIILMIHIAGAFGSYNPETRGLLQRFKPQVLICGHSHILKVAHDHRFSCLYINPGAAGNHGFHPVKTMITFHVKNGKPTEMDVIELGRRIG
jgi:putative phosphoesterase